jgi:hypothetical protein
MSPGLGIPALACLAFQSKLQDQTSATVRLPERVP